MIFIVIFNENINPVSNRQLIIIRISATHSHTHTLFLSFLTYRHHTEVKSCTFSLQQSILVFFHHSSYLHLFPWQIQTPPSDHMEIHVREKFNGKEASLEKHNWLQFEMIFLAFISSQDLPPHFSKTYCHLVFKATDCMPGLLVAVVLFIHGQCAMR